MRSRSAASLRPPLLSLLCALPVGCAARPAIERPPGTVRYAGSSAVTVFLRQAEPRYGAVEFAIDTGPGSAGGERMIREGAVDLAGTARMPDAETLGAGVKAARIGRDAIAVIVNAENAIEDLDPAHLAGLFTGRIRNWREVGGPDLEVRAFIAGEGSATRSAFRAALLGSEEYRDCRTVAPDAALIEAVARHPGAIGQVSLALLGDAEGVRPVAIGGERPDPANPGYPIARPLYLLWREPSPVVESFVAWAVGEEGQQVAMRSFAGQDVLGPFGPKPPDRGVLVVRTQTFEVRDGENLFSYFPHRPYDILTRNGESVRWVWNHLHERDETPSRVHLPAGTYLIRTRVSGRGEVEFLVTIEAGRVTEVDVEKDLDRIARVGS